MDHKKDFESTLNRLRKRFNQYKEGTFAYNKYKDAYDKVYMAYINWELEEGLIETIAECETWYESLPPNLREILKLEMERRMEEKWNKEAEEFDRLEEQHLDDSRRLEMEEEMASDRELREIKEREFDAWMSDDGE